LLKSGTNSSTSFCHPFVEALAGIISDAPVKLVIAICFNLILYFLAGLNPTPSQFFIFFLFTILVRFTMSAMFRTIAATTKTVSQALAIAAILVLAIVIYTGYTIPLPYMHPWFRWLNYINPLAFAFEALMANEFHGREFPCARYLHPKLDHCYGRMLTFVVLCRHTQTFQMAHSYAPPLVLS
jgi:ATP-binding cassette, subfamily G (WHITE), member 2, PDR